jgi:hypothetical protein
MDLIIEFEQLLDLDLKYVCQILREKPIKHIKELTICDLILTPSGPIITNNGVYIFFSPNAEVAYIGKAEKKSFVERIPSHFDPRGNQGWFNTILKKLIQNGNANSFDEALIQSLEYSVRLINFTKHDNLRSYCSKLERLLRKELSPRLNPLSQRVRNRIDSNMEISLRLNLK